MSRSIAAVFIFVGLAVQATFALIDYPRETVTLELTDEDLVQARSVSDQKTFFPNLQNTRNSINALAVFSKSRLENSDSLLLILYVMVSLQI